jgi:hypothetical protein
MNKFKLAPHSPWDKRIYIDGPWQLAVEIDHDDVDHRAVKKDAKKLVALLNAHWMED